MATTMTPFKRMLATGTAGAAFTDKTITTTKPVAASGIFVVDLTEAENSGGKTPQWFEIVPIVGEADGETALFRVWAWNRITISGTVYWMPKAIVVLTCTATDSSAAAVDAATTPFFCDTIANTRGDATVKLSSPTNDEIASARVPIYGAELVQVDWVMGTGANANMLYRFFNE